MGKNFLQEFWEKFRKFFEKNDMKRKIDSRTLDEAYVGMAVDNNRKFFLFISIFIILIELFNIFRVLFMTRGVGISTRNNFIYFSFYLVLLLVSILYIYINKRMDLDNMKLYRIHMVCGTVFILWQTLFNIYDIIRTGSAANLTLPVVFMAFSAIFMMKPFYFLVNIGGMAVLFLMLAGQTVSVGVKINYAIMMLFCTVIYFQRYHHAMLELAQRYEIETANRAYLEEHERFRLTQEQYEIVCRSSQLVTLKWDVKNGGAYFSEQWSKALGQPLYISNLENFVKKSERLPKQEKDCILECAKNVKNKIPYQKMEIRIPGNDGKLNWYELRLTTQENSDGEPVFGIGILLDIMEHKQEIKKMHQQAETDFTGVLNKSAIEKYGRECIEQLSEDEMLIMFILDMDNFKYVNDTMGHPMGDYVLLQVATYLKENVLPRMHIGRIGGDEFMVLFTATGTQSLRIANDFAEKMQNYIQNMKIADGTVDVKCSIGAAAISKKCGVTFERLYAAADKALYEAKKGGKGIIRWELDNPSAVY